MLFFNFSKKDKQGFYDKGDQEHLTELLNMSSAAKDKKNPTDK